MVSAELIELVMLKGNLLELISEHTELTFTGMNHDGICPFCKAESASFVVIESTGCFYCQNCRKSGDLFKFVELYYELDFLDAVSFLARKYDLVSES